MLIFFLNHRLNIKIFQNSLYEMLRKVLPNSNEMSNLLWDVAFAWKTFLFDNSSNDIFGVRGERRPGKIYSPNFNQYPFICSYRLLFTTF